MLRKRIGYLMLAFILVLSTVPLEGDRSHAAVNLEILNWVRSANQPAEPSRVTTSSIDLEVDYTQISENELRNLYYVISEVRTGISREVKDNIPVRVPGIDQRVVFRNVDLYEGLNKIQVFLDSPSNPQSIPVWVNFTEVATINDLTAEGALLTNGRFLPEANPLPGQTNIFIRGTAPNATSVRGFTTLTPGGQPGTLFSGSGEFDFMAGTRNVDLQLRPGDNELTVLAENMFKTYRSTREFVYNDGSVFLFNTRSEASEGLESDSDNDKLYLQPTFSATTESPTNGYLIDLKTDVKLNVTHNDLTHQHVQLQINEANDYLTVEFQYDPNNSHLSYVVVDAHGPIVDDDGNVVAGDLDYDTDLSGGNQYIIARDLEIPGLELDASRPNQLLQATFIDLHNSNADYTQEFPFHFVNELAPYVRSVILGDSGGPLYSGIEVTISQETIDLEVITENNADGVELYLPDQSPNPIPVDVTKLSGPSDPSVDRYLIRLNQSLLPEGRSTLRFVPLQENSAGDLIPRTVGAKEYLVNYNPSPYVYVTNIYNGQVFESNERAPIGYDVLGNTIAGPLFQIKPVNIPRSQWRDIRVVLNDQSDRIRDRDRFADGSTEELRFYFGTSSLYAGRRGDGWRLHNGLNRLQIEVYPENTLSDSGDPGSVKPITTFEYQIYYFSDRMPEVVSLDIERETLSEGRFVQLDNVTTRYYTQEREVAFQTFVRNADEIDIIYHDRDENDQQLEAASVTLEWGGSSGSRRFTVKSGHASLVERNGEVRQSVNDPSASNGTAEVLTNRLQLRGTGTYTLEVIARTDAGLTSSRMIEIVREPASFVVHYPLIDPETRVGTVNGNYTRFYVEAEKADRIQAGRNLEVTTTTPVELDNGEVRDMFVFEVDGLKRGRNEIDFTVFRGELEENATVTLYHADTAVPGAEFKASIDSSRIRAFDRSLELRFPRGTILKRNDSRANDPALSPIRDIFVGIADPVDGRVNKMLHPAFNEQGSPFPKKGEWDSRYLLLREPTDRFRPISQLYWIDGGMVTGSQQEVLFGSGSYPYERGQEFYTRNAGNHGEMFVPSQPGTLTLSYDPNMVDSAWRYITVYHYGLNEDHLGHINPEWKNIGGVVDTRNNTITVPIEEFGYYVVMYMEYSYDDIIGHPWARDYLDTLFAKGMMKPKGLNRFETNDPISRGEFVTLIVKGFELPLNYEMQSDFSNAEDGWQGMFSDVGQVSLYSDGLYSYKYIETAGRAGIVRGTLNNRFLPDANITREEAAAIIARAANLRLNSNADKVMSDLESTFTDAGDIDDYAKASVLAVANKGFITGKPNVTGSMGNAETFYFDPKASMTRAEAAVIIMKVLLDNKRIPSL